MEIAPARSARLTASVPRWVRTATRPAAYLGAAKEVAVGAWSTVTYPLGLGRPAAADRLIPAEQRTGHSLAQRSRLAADPETALLPVLLVHGWFHNRSAFLVMARALRAAGFHNVSSVGYDMLRHDVDSLARLLAADVDRALEQSGALQCMLVGHSLGGLVARAYVQDHGGEDTVDTVVTIGTPHAGTKTSLLGPGASARAMRPGSAFLRDLDRTARPGPVRWIAYSSDLDAVIRPTASARLTTPVLQATNVVVRDAGHLSLLVSPTVVRGVIGWLCDRTASRAAARGSHAPAHCGAAVPTTPRTQRRDGRAPLGRGPQQAG